jgi:hypothetical protein
VKRLALAILAAAALGAQGFISAQPGDRKEAAAIFVERIAPVLMHPRCLNCHTNVAFPRQGDERRRHDFLVSRGPTDSGPPGFGCATCHQDSNQPTTGVPGAPNWHLAPLAMGWEGLSPGVLCRNLKDPRRNGGKDLHALAEHMGRDPLVLWGWSPGPGRTPVPVPHREFALAVERWAALGGACPS